MPITRVKSTKLEKWIYNINDHASPGHDFITSKSRSKHGDTIMQVIEHIYIFIVHFYSFYHFFYFYDEF